MQTSLAATHDISGFIGACLVDTDSGLMVASEGGGRLDMEAVAALNTTFFKSKLKAIEELGLNDEVEDICITLGQQVHLIRPLETMKSMFLYVALERKQANLGMARIQVRKIESTLAI